MIFQSKDFLIDVRKISYLEEPSPHENDNGGYYKVVVDGNKLVIGNNLKFKNVIKEYRQLKKAWLSVLAGEPNRPVKVIIP